MPRETGTSVTIGGQSPNYLYIDWSTVDDAPNNRTLVYWAAGFRYTNSDAQLDDCDISLAGLRYDNPGRVKNYAGTFVTRDHGIVAWNTPGYSAFYVGHDANGNGSMVISGSIGGNLGGRSTISARTVTFTNYDRTPTTPSFVSGSRTSNGTSFSTTSWSGGVNNSGPQVTWTLQRSTVSNFSSNVVDIASTTTSNGTLTSSSLDPTTTYYYRIRASNSDTGNTSAHPNPKYSGVITSVGVPSAPTSFSASVSTTDSGKITCSWLAPSNTQGGITGYDFYVGGTKVNTSNITGTSYTVNTKSLTTTDYLIPGTNYELYVVAKNAVGFNNSTAYSRSSSLTRRAPGAPAAPTLPANYVTGGITYSNPINFGRDVTITCDVSPDDFGIPINTSNAEQGYFVQYRFSDEAAGTYSAWSTPVKMSDQTNRVHTFPLLDAAKWYKFRIYAANTIINNAAGTKTYYPHNSGIDANFSVETTALFVPAAGKRFDGSNFVITNTAKRYNAATNSWVNIATAKRYNEVQGTWENLT
jgi:hypothetical protein